MRDRHTIIARALLPKYCHVRGARDSIDVQAAYDFLDTWCPIDIESLADHILIDLVAALGVEFYDRRKGV